MQVFEIREDPNALYDANGRRLEHPPIPGERILEDLRIHKLHEAGLEGVSVISSLPEVADEEPEDWEPAEVPAKATKLAVERIMTELAGESWFDCEKEDGYSAGELLELLSRKAFVQFSRLTVANIKACLDNGGRIIAYFPDLVWREYFRQLPAVPGEVLGMRAVEIVEVHDGTVTVNDPASPQGMGLRLDMASFDWLSQGGWLLEVYK